MKDHLAALRKTFDKEIKEKDLAANKAVCLPRRFLPDPILISLISQGC